jgi:hypothetical protein
MVRARQNRARTAPVFVPAPAAGLAGLTDRVFERSICRE